MVGCGATLLSVLAAILFAGCASMDGKGMPRMGAEGKSYGADFVNRQSDWRLVSSHPESRLEFRDGVMWVKARRDCTIWLAADTFGGDFVLCMKARTIEPHGAANLNVIFMLWCLDGSDPLAAKFDPEEHRHAFKDISRGYMATLTKKWCRMRRNPGYELVSDDQETKTEPGKVHEIRIARMGKRITYTLDGRRIHDVADIDPVPSGRVAIRSWGTTFEVLAFSIEEGCAGEDDVCPCRW